jgi:eukaryotic-like serine/threonine-protein kinase
MEPAAPLIAGRFRIEHEVGRGGVGTVHRAFDARTDRYVALKIIAVSGLDTADQARLSHEGQILSELNHPSIVRVVAFGTLEASATDGEGRRLDEGATFIAMEWLDGEDLQERQRRAPLSLRDSLEVGRQVANALAAAHDAGVIHRDIKPSNILLLNGSLRTKLVDFGVASSNDVLLTDPGGFVGTPAYMSPEQARGDARVDARSDLYSLGATLFELIAGRPPHLGPTSIATLVRLATTPAPRLSELLLDVSPELDELIYTMLLADRELRPSSAREVAQALAALSRMPGLPKPKPLLRVSDNPPAVMGTRLVTTIVALHVAAGDDRQKELEALRRRGADALPLGTDSVVAHLGVRQAHGDEAARALELGLALGEHGGRGTPARAGCSRTRPRSSSRAGASRASTRAPAPCWCWRARSGAPTERRPRSSGATPRSSRPSRRSSAAPTTGRRSS